MKNPKHSGKDDGEFFMRWLNNDLSPEERANLKNREDYDAMERLTDQSGLVPEEQSIFKKKSSVNPWLLGVLLVIILIGILYFTTNG